MKYKTQISWLSCLQTFTAKIYFTFLLSFIIHPQALGQFTDDFSDDDFTNSPPWRGVDSLFTISGSQLKLQAPNETGRAYLSTPCGILENASWEFKVTLEFNPSASNYARIYLFSDQPDVSGSLNGYFVMVGNSEDEVSLYRQTGMTYSKIIDGRDGVLDLSTVAVKIKVTRNGNGEWQLYSDVGATGEYIEEGTMEDVTFLDTSHFGILCIYTSSRSDKFLFDDFIVSGDIPKDELPPIVDNVEIISAQQLQVTFSETLDQAIATEISNYSVNNGIGYPEGVILAADKKTASLIFSKKFPESLPCILTVSGIADVNGNVMETWNKNFLYYTPAFAGYKDIIITEIFADPSPSLGLPELEFVELFNRGEKAFSLTGYKFSDPGTTAILPDFILPPNEYVILTSKNSEYEAFGNVLSLSNFPTLNNSSDMLVLKDVNDVTLDSVYYSDDWYKDDDKKNGGWSLELIDPHNVCSEQANWVGSENSHGGSPGQQNSVFANKPDVTGPKLLSAIPLTSTRIRLQFDEKLEKQLPLSLNFTITPSIEVANVSFLNSALSNLELSLAQEIQAGIPYSVSVNTIFDCAGNRIQEEFNNIDFGLPELADSLNVLINEILFNPRPTGVDFVEIVNTSEKYLNLKNWSIANLENEVLKNVNTILNKDFLFKPGSYLVLTESVDILSGEYSQSEERNFLQVKTLPNFSNDLGSVVLADSNGVVIDYLIYSKDMHSVYIKDEEGVSLERIAFDAPSNSDHNWKSASATAGFATPGYINSNSARELSLGSDPLNIEPEIFNPLGGQPDFTQIHYNFDQGGYVANVKIFDSHGQLIKQLANNDVLGTTGFYRWDGDRDDGSKVRVGYYMIWFEIFDAHGMTKKYQKRVAVAATF